MEEKEWREKNEGKRMKGYKYWTFLILAAVIVLLVLPRVSFSASSENYQVPESVINEGGGEMSSSNHTVVSSHGHPVSGNEMHSVNFSVSSGFVASALPAIEANIDIDPDTLNLRSHGRWITCYITLPEGYPKDVFDPTAVVLTRVNGQTLASFIFSDLEAIAPKRAHVRDNESGNYPDMDEDNSEDSENDEDILQVKFIRSEVQAIVPLGDEVELTVTGNLLNGATFQGTNNIRVINPGEQKGEPQNKSNKGK